MTTINCKIVKTTIPESYFVQNFSNEGYMFLEMQVSFFERKSCFETSQNGSTLKRNSVMSPVYTHFFELGGCFSVQDSSSVNILTCANLIRPTNISYHH